MANRRIIGNVRDTDLYDVPLSLSDAQAMVDCTRDHFGIEEPITVRYSSRSTKRKMAHFALSLDGQREILCYPGGQNMGTLCHEIAHHFAMNHGPVFKAYHLAILKLWE